MGAWLGVSVMLALGVYRNFDSVESVLKAPPEKAERIVRVLGPDVRRLLRYTAGVQNAKTFEVWEDIQIGLGALIAMVLFLSSSMRYLSVVPLVMILLVLFMHLKITPELAWLGRSLEFSSGDDALPSDHFWTLHRIYAILDTVKCVLGAAVAIFLMAQSSTKVVRRRHRHERDTLAELDRHAASR